MPDRPHPSKNFKHPNFNTISSHAKDIWRYIAERLKAMGFQLTHIEPLPHKEKTLLNDSLERTHLHSLARRYKAINNNAIKRNKHLIAMRFQLTHIELLPHKEKTLLNDWLKGTHLHTLARRYNFPDTSTLTHFINQVLTNDIQTR